MEARSSVQPFVSSGYFYKPLRNVVDPAGSSSASSAAKEPTGQDSVTLSQEGQEQSLRTTSSQSATEPEPTKNAAEMQLDQQEIEQLQKLKLRDKEVRTHEQAHLSTAGQYARGGMSFGYQKGPDGVAYAVSGEVGIDLGKESTPEATLLKMQTIKRAALAPADPSGADRQIAAQATAKEAQARQEILRETQEELLQAVVSTVTSPEGNDSQAPTQTKTEEHREPSSYASLKRAITAYISIAEG